MKPAFDLPTSALPTTSAESASRLVDFYELTKPRMNFLIVITTMVGFCMASVGTVNWTLLFHTCLGTALTAASAAVFNQLIERRHDAKMKRTNDRPIAAGRVDRIEATLFGSVLGLAGLLYLGLAVNGLTALLGLATWVLYIAVYTPMKRLSTLNTIVGAIPGAIPPLMGYTAIQNSISAEGLTLFAILFFWQMPHFLAIAILFKNDYAAAGFRMLPCKDPDLRLTIRMIILYTAALLPISLLPTVQRSCGNLYFIAAGALGASFLTSAVLVARQRTTRSARQLFFCSIIYLPLLLAAMMFDKR